MTQSNSVIHKAVQWSLDPATRAQAALRRAERKGMARKMEPLERALADADDLGIQFYGKQLEDYLRVVGEVAPIFTSLSSPQPAQPVRLLSPVPATNSQAQPPAYMLSSATLAQAHAQLTKHLPGAGEEPEWMLAVTGMKLGNLRTLEHLIDVSLASQSAARASFDMQEFARIAITLDEKGMALHAIFHSHRFAGPPQPSAVDWRLQDLLDQGGYPAIQAVFSEDGYIRFFARRAFTVAVSGKGVECVDPTASLYRLVHFGTLPNPGTASATGREHTVIRPFSAHSGR